VPAFFFNVQGDHPTEEAVELPSIAEAKATAIRYAARLLSDSATTFWESGQLSISVTDQSGLILFTIDVLGNDAPSIRAELPLAH
jgi:Domain of unknown function (DUF6894)